MANRPCRSIFASGFFLNIIGMKQPTAKTTGPLRPFAILLLSLSLGLASCSYSIIVVSKKGTPEPDPLNNVQGFYALKKVNTLDTVSKLSVFENGVQVNLGSGSTAGFHSIEYKITFGDMLRNTFTFGKRRGIHVKYVRLKDSND